MYIHFYRYIDVYICSCIYLYMYVYTYIHTNEYIYICIYIYPYIYIYICNKICIYSSICTYIRIYIDTCINDAKQKKRRSGDASTCPFESSTRPYLSIFLAQMLSRISRTSTSLSFLPTSLTCRLMPYAISITAATQERARAKMVSVPAAIGASGSAVFGLQSRY